MPHVSFAIDTILKDLNDLENEINRELSKESETGLPQIMAENGYAKQLGDIRERISLLLEKVKSRLSNLLRLRDLVVSKAVRQEHPGKGRVRLTVLHPSRNS